MKMVLRIMIVVAISLFALVASFASNASAQKSDEKSAAGGPDGHTSAPTPGDLCLVSPALERYRQGPLIGDLWKRPGLSERDRCIVTLAEAMVEQTVKKFGRLDAAYNNAGIQNVLAESADSPGTITTG